MATQRKPVVDFRNQSPYAPTPGGKRCPSRNSTDHRHDPENQQHRRQLRPPSTPGMTRHNPPPASSGREASSAITPKLQKVKLQKQVKAKPATREQQRASTAGKSKSPADVWSNRKTAAAKKSNSNGVEEAHKEDDRSRMSEKFKCMEECVTQYTMQVHANRSEEAEQIINKAAVIAHENTDANGSELYMFANELLEKEKLLASTMIFELAASFFAHEEDGSIAALRIYTCGRGLWLCASAFIHKPDFKHLVKDHVLPLLEGLIVKVKRIHNCDCVARFTNIADLIVCVVNVYGMLGEYDMAEQMCQQGLLLLETQLPDTCTEHFVYGGLSASLGLTCMASSRYTDAVVYFSQALRAFEVATDFPTSDDRKQLMEQCEGYLKHANDEMV